MKSSGGRTAVAIIVAAVLVAAGLVGSTLLQAPKTVTSTSEEITTVQTTVTDVVTSNHTVTMNVTESQLYTGQSTSSSYQPQTSTSFSCTVTGTGGPIFFQVVTDQGMPVSNETVKVVHTGPNVDGYSCGSAMLSPMQTNTTGWVEIKTDDGLPYAGSFEVSFVYLGQDYNATIGIEPLLITLFTYYVPSGQTYSLNCLPSGCSTTTSDTMMGG